MATTINAGRVRFVSRGTYNNSTQYYLFDLVDYNGSSYIAKENSLGNLPTSTQYWQLIAEKGNTGNTGATGPVGPTGNGISSIEKTGTSGLVDTYTITYTDGTTSTFQVTNGEDAEITPEEFEKLQNEVNELKDENQRLKETLPTTKGSGENITLNKTAEMEFVVPPLPIGNTVQDGELTPTNPVEAQVVKGDVEVLIQNKNLLDISELVTQTQNGVKITKNKDNSITLDGTSTSAIAIDVPINEITLKEKTNYIFSKGTSTSGAVYALSLRDGNRNYIEPSSLDSGNKFININSNTNQTAKYFRLYIVGNRTFINHTFYPMLEENTTTTSYTPHQEQTLPLTLGDIELCKIGDYKDYFYRDNNKGKWYLHKEIIKNVSNGTENDWNRVNTITEGQYRFMNRTLENIILNPSNNGQIGKSLNNLLINQSANYNYTCNDSVAISQEGSVFVYYSDINNYTISEFRNWLTTHNLILYCVLKTPTNTEITDTTLKSQLEAINNAISYYEQTNISGTSSGISPLFDVEAYQNTKLLLEDIINSN